MKKRSTRWLRTLVLALVPTSLVASAFVLVPSAAYAVAAPGFTTYTGTGNLTVLPSTAQPLFAGVADASPQGQVGQYLYAAMKDPKKMAAITALYQRAQAGTATATETAELTTALRASAPVATRTALLTRGVASVAGPAGLVITSAQMGFAIGAGVSSAMGMDVDGGLCRGGAGGQALAFVSGVSCSKFWETVNKTTINSDASSGAVGSNVCVPGTTSCASWVGTTTNQQYGRVWHSFKASGVRAPDDANSLSSTDRQFYLQVTSTQGNVMQTYFVAPDGPNPDRVNCIKGSTACTYDGNNLKTGGVASYTWVNVTTRKPVGDVGKVGTSTGDPDRAMRCTQTYKSGGRDTRTGDSRKLSEGMPPAPDLPVPAGEIVTNITCELYAGDGTAPAYETFKQDTSPEYQKSAAVNPECGSTTVCELQLVKPDGRVCNDTDTTCADWTRAPDSDQWTCRWGNTAIGFKPADMSECNWYGERWSPEAQRTGNTLTRPAASSPTNTPEPIKNPNPAANPNTAPGVGSSPADADLPAYECWPSGWGAINPLNWVLQPLKCAFVPREGYPEKLQQRNASKWKNTAPAKLAAAMTAWDLKTPADGCRGIPVSMHYGVLNFDANILAACPGDVLAPFAGWSRLFVAFSMSVAGVFALVRWGGALFGFEGFGRKGDDD